IVFSAIAQATADSAIIFADQPACSADLLLWARREVTFAFSLLRRNILCSAASPGGLHAASECVCISLGHARLLEPQGISLAPMLGQLMRPSVMEALEFNIMRIEDAVVSVATSDEWHLEPIDLGAPSLQAAGLAGRAGACWAQAEADCERTALLSPACGPDRGHTPCNQPPLTG
ncbi:hypothetical protein CLOM_g17666, partial [Closterium sp. NIES-68]